MHCKNSVQEALLGGDLFSVVTYFYQNRNVKSWPGEAVNETI